MTFPGHIFFFFMSKYVNLITHLLILLLRSFTLRLVSLSCSICKGIITENHIKQFEIKMRLDERIGSTSVFDFISDNPYIFEGQKQINLLLTKPFGGNMKNKAPIIVYLNHQMGTAHT